MDDGPARIALRRMPCPAVPDGGRPSSLVMAVHRQPEALLVKAAIHRYEPGEVEIAQARRSVLAALHSR